jgi:hypothetical protein
MLSLKEGTKIAMMNKDKNKCIYIKNDDKQTPAEIETTPQKKFELFKNFIEKDKKLMRSQIDNLLDAYKNNTKIDDKLSRKYEEALKFVDTSLKYYLDFSKKTELTPIMPNWYTLFVSGTTGSGKSYYIANLLKYNKPKFIFIMSPIKDDPAYKSMKPEPVYIDLDNYFDEYNKFFEIEDLPPNSVVILDDIDTDAKKAKPYQEIKTQILERGRHIPVSCICISHDPLGGNVKHAKAQIRESHYYVIFPKANKAHCENFITRYITKDTELKNRMLEVDTRGLLIKKTYPAYYLGEHQVGIIN